MKGGSKHFVKALASDCSMSMKDSRPHSFNVLDDLLCFACLYELHRSLASKPASGSDLYHLYAMTGVTN